MVQKQIADKCGLTDLRLRQPFERIGGHQLRLPPHSAENLARPLAYVVVTSDEIHQSPPGAPLLSALFRTCNTNGLLMFPTSRNVMALQQRSDSLNSN